MDIITLTFGVPFLIGLFLGFCFKGFLNRYEKRRALDRHMDGLFKETFND